MLKLKVKLQYYDTRRRKYAYAFVKSKGCRNVLEGYDPGYDKHQKDCDIVRV
jgi:hypothetical protein